jgi:hypothetical protein
MNKLGLALLTAYPPFWLIYSNDHEFCQELLSKETLIEEIPENISEESRLLIERENEQIRKILGCFT